MFSEISETQKITKETAKNYSSNELGVMYNYQTKALKFTRQCLHRALNTWTSDWKVENAKKNVAKDKEIHYIIVEELKDRGVKSVKGNGEVVYA